MKIISIEGGDALGKNLLIKGLCKYFNYENITIRHLGKPPKTFSEDISPLEWQIKCFEKEAFLLENLKQMEEDEYQYYENIVIYNRFIWGEYIYGLMFRNQDCKEIENFIKNFEERYLISNPQTYLILLTADPEFFLEQEDGKSFSKNIGQKTRELQLFDEIFEKSLLDNKLRIKVNDGNSFLPKSYILGTVINFLKQNNEI
jgi:thymidylate kinase